MSEREVEPKVVTFFYGSYMDPEVLAEADVVPERLEVAWVPGFEIVIERLANLIPSNRHMAYGILAHTTHAELARLYDQARDVLGAAYHPQAVLAWTPSGQLEPALCYLSPEVPAGPPAAEYVARIIAPARKFGFPDWYVRRLESFLP